MHLKIKQSDTNDTDDLKKDQVTDRLILNQAYFKINLKPIPD